MRIFTSPKEMIDRIAELEAELATYKQDALRYRWITSDGCGCPFAETDDAWDSKESLDAAIDLELR